LNKSMPDKSAYYYGGYGGYGYGYGGNRGRE
jgi:hypothetical protein